MQDFQLIQKTHHINHSFFQVIEWLTFATTELSPLLDDKLAKINDWLVSRTLLVGNVITLADLVLYAVVHPATSSFPIAQHIHFLQLLRWYDYVHAVADPSNIFPAASFEKPRLVRPLPSLPASTASIAPPSTPPPPPLSNDANKEKKRNKGDDTAPVSVATASNKETKIKEKKKSNDTATTSTEPTVDVLDIRIGIITKVGPHPGADGLYVEDIDVGEDHPRQVVSGLRKFVALEHMEHRRVVVVCNLKPAKMREVMSCGMVLCASNEDHTVVDPITPPQGAAVGERVQFEGFSAQPEAQLNPKKKIFERIAPFLVTSAGMFLCVFTCICIRVEE